MAWELADALSVKTGHVWYRHWTTPVKCCHRLLPQVTSWHRLLFIKLRHSKVTRLICVHNSRQRRPGIEMFLALRTKSLAMMLIWIWPSQRLNVSLSLLGSRWRCQRLDRRLLCSVVVCCQIKWGACGLVLAGNTVVFITILLFFYFFGHDDSFEYSTW